jgi:hypothetical protein
LLVNLPSASFFPVNGISIDLGSHTHTLLRLGSYLIDPLIQMRKTGLDGDTFKFDPGKKYVFPIEESEKVRFARDTVHYNLSVNREELNEEEIKHLFAGYPLSNIRKAEIFIPENHLGIQIDAQIRGLTRKLLILENHNTDTALKVLEDAKVIDRKITVYEPNVLSQLRSMRVPRTLVPEKAYLILNQPELDAQKIEEMRGLLISEDLFCNGPYFLSIRPIRSENTHMTGNRYGTDFVEYGLEIKTTTKINSDIKSILYDASKQVESALKKADIKFKLM